jgi:hypothetical protein
MKKCKGIGLQRWNSNVQEFLFQNIHENVSSPCFGSHFFCAGSSPIPRSPQCIFHIMNWLTQRARPGLLAWLDVMGSDTEQPIRRWRVSCEWSQEKLQETHGNPASCWGEEPLVYDGLWFNQLVFSVKIPLWFSASWHLSVAPMDDMVVDIVMRAIRASVSVILGISQGLSQGHAEGLAKCS